MIRAVTPQFNLSPGEGLTVQTPQSGDPVALEVVAALPLEGVRRRWLVQLWDGALAELVTADEAAPQTVLRREEELLGALAHSNLAKTLGSVEQGGHLLCARERVFPNPLLLLSDPEIRQHFAKSDAKTHFLPPPAPVALKLVADLLAGVAYLHAKGEVHGGLGLEELGLRVASQASVRAPTRHALLKALLGGEAELVLHGLGADGGPALYAPPELLLQREAHPSRDLYAAALLGYSLLSGRAPYDHLPGPPPTQRARLEQLKRRELGGELLPFDLEPLSQTRGLKRLAPELFKLLKSCARPEPARRLEARQAVAEIRRLQSGATSRRRAR